MTDADARDVQRMQLALRAAERGRPRLLPRTGAVLVRAEQVIAVAHQARDGSQRPEAVVLARAGLRARGATLYLTLDPGDTSGATTRRCDAIVHAGVARVVIGCRDPGPVRPAAPRLRRAGVRVDSGVLRAAAERSIADYRKFQRERLPWVTLKAAVTLDGRIAARSGESKWITGAPARREAHRLRAAADAIMVGVSTVLADDPELTTRLYAGASPLRVVLDSQLRTPPGAKLVLGARRVPTLIFHAPDASPRRARRLSAAGVELVSLARGRNDKGLPLKAALRALAERGVARLLVEGGSRVHAALLDAGLADQAAVFVAPRILGDARAVPLAAGERSARLSNAWTIDAPRIRRVGDDVLIEGPLYRPAPPKD